MKRECVQKFLSGFFVFCITLSFSILSFAEAFTGAYLYTGTDPVTGQPIVEVRGVNPTGQTFSGSNVIEMNAYNNAPVLTNNTFNGSTDINPDFTDITSTGNHYNGSVDITYNGMGGTLDSNGDTFQSTSVTAQQSDLSINNGTFNGATNITANSVSLGSISQMDSLLDEIYIFYYNLSVARAQGNSTPFSTTNPYTGNTVQIPMVMSQCEGLQFSNGAFSIRNYQPGAAYLYGTTRAWLNHAFNTIGYSFNALGQGLQYFIQRNGTYEWYQFSVDGEYYSLTKTSQSSDIRGALLNRLDVIVNLLNWYCGRFFNWYYPLDNVLPEYWRYYNTDTGQQEEIGLAGLMYNISWYLGQLYVLQTASDALDNFEDQVAAVTDTFEDAEAAEESIMQSINSGISSFNPDVSQFGAFRALGWCSNYLQLVFLRLGTYGTVLLIGLLLGVCMQFVGYFRYK